MIINYIIDCPLFDRSVSFSCRSYFRFEFLIYSMPAGRGVYLTISRTFLFISSKMITFPSLLSVLVSYLLYSSNEKVNLALH